MWEHGVGFILKGSSQLNLEESARKECTVGERMGQGDPNKVSFIVKVSWG